MNMWNTEDSLDLGNTLYDPVMMESHHFTYVQTHRMNYTTITPRVNYNINYGLWVIMFCQCSFIRCNKCTPTVGEC